MTGTPENIRRAPEKRCQPTLPGICVHPAGGSGRIYRPDILTPNLWMLGNKLLKHACADIDVQDQSVALYSTIVPGHLNCWRTTPACTGCLKYNKAWCSTMEVPLRQPGDDVAKLKAAAHTPAAPMEWIWLSSQHWISDGNDKQLCKNQRPEKQNKKQYPGLSLPIRCITPCEQQTPNHRNQQYGYASNSNAHSVQPQ
jgi:hypothetical protein